MRTLFGCRLGHIGRFDLKVECVCDRMALLSMDAFSCGEKVGAEWADYCEISDMLQLHLVEPISLD